MKNADQPAFPCSASQPGSPAIYPGSKGMTLRDYFAAKAMQGILHEAETFWVGAAPLAYEYADAMMKAREQ
jgi:hypothetical protein